jgi:hypothetical protein
MSKDLGGGSDLGCGREKLGEFNFRVEKGCSRGGVAHTTASSFEQCSDLVWTPIMNGPIAENRPAWRVCSVITMK